MNELKIMNELVRDLKELSLIDCLEQLQTSDYKMTLSNISLENNIYYGWYTVKKDNMKFTFFYHNDGKFWKITNN